MNYWLVKSEPNTYSWAQFLQDGETFWDGVRNYQARNNLKAMKKGDRVLFYHSNIGMCVLGIAEVVKEFYQDPSTEDDRWVAVDIKPIKALPQTVPLSEIKQQPGLKEIGLVKQSRLSVVDLKKKEYDLILKLGGLKPE